MMPCCATTNATKTVLHGWMGIFDLQNLNKKNYKSILDRHLDVPPYVGNLHPTFVLKEEYLTQFTQPTLLVVINLQHSFTAQDPPLHTGHLWIRRQRKPASSISSLKLGHLLCQAYQVWVVVARTHTEAVLAAGDGWSWVYRFSVCPLSVSSIYRLL